MRRLLGFILTVFVIVLMSCESRNPVEKYGDDVTGAYTATQRLSKQADIKNLQDAIRSFHVMNGRYPDDIKELEHYVGTPLDSSKYDYDPAEGTIKAKQ